MSRTSARANTKTRSAKQKQRQAYDAQINNKRHRRSMKRQGRK